MADSARPLEGRTALVTGAGRNIGRAIAIALAGSGANVAVNVRANLDEADNVVTEARKHDVRAMAVAADVSSLDDVAAMFERVQEQLGTVDILLNNAAVRPHQAFLDITPDDWNWVLGVGLTGAFYCAKAAVPGMVEQGWGRIVNISGRDGFSGIRNRAHGVTVKAGIHGFTKALALELGEHGITVNTVVPGLIMTTRPEQWYPHLDYGERAKSIPVGHVGDPEDIAGICRYLICDAGYITGQAIHVNGGEFLIT